MACRNDGGAAFPIPGFEDGNGNIHCPGYGMSLRDYFAGQALAGLAAGEGDAAPQYAYFLADRMLAERIKDQSNG